MKPLALDLFCGLGGWSEGLLATGWDVIGFDIEAHAYDGERYPAQLVLQDVRTLHGSQFKTADLIVASPPCQAYSWMAMPWTRAKAKAAAIRADDTGEALRKLNELFDACFRIQREASEAAGRHIPMVCENVRGAIPWVGRSAYNFGSYHLWGDVPALMPIVRTRKVPTRPTVHRGDGSSLTNIQVGEGIKGAHGTSGSQWTNPAERDGLKNAGFRFDGSGRSFQSESVARHITEGSKHHGDWFRDPACPTRQGGQSKGRGVASPRRKAASAKIAKIPLALSEWIGRVYLPRAKAA